MPVLLGIARLAAFLLFCLIVLVVHGAYKIFGRHWSISKKTCGILCRIFGYTPRIVGTPYTGHGKPVLFVANHLSYLDIPALAASVDTVFVAKSEVGTWPLIGTMAKIQKTVFIVRIRTALEATKQAVAAMLKAGKNIVIFVEGTSTNGAIVKPFKAGLFDAAYAEGVDAWVQPVAIVLETVNGVPVGTDEVLRDRYAWWRPEHTLVPHLWAFGCTPKTGIAIHFLPPLDPQDYADRKSLAQAAHRAVSAVVEDAARIGYNPMNTVPVAQLDRAPVS